jgi:hypothetical protein
MLDFEKYQKMQNNYPQMPKSIQGHALCSAYLLIHVPVYD